MNVSVRFVSSCVGSATVTAHVSILTTTFALPVDATLSVAPPAAAAGIVNDPPFVSQNTPNAVGPCAVSTAAEIEPSLRIVRTPACTACALLANVSVLGVPGSTKYAMSAVVSSWVRNAVNMSTIPGGCADAPIAVQLVGRGVADTLSVTGSVVLKT